MCGEGRESIRYKRETLMSEEKKKKKRLRNTKLSSLKHKQLRFNDDLVETQKIEERTRSYLNRYSFL